MTVKVERNWQMVMVKRSLGTADRIKRCGLKLGLDSLGRRTPDYAVLDAAMILYEQRLDDDAAQAQSCKGAGCETCGHAQDKPCPGERENTASENPV